MTLLAAVMIAIGMVGIILPVLPGLLLVWGGVAVWALGRHDGAGWLVLALVTGLALAGVITKYLLPVRRLQNSGVPGRTIAVGSVFGLVGFFAIPVVGLFVGFILGVYLAERSRLAGCGPTASAQAQASTKEALVAVGWSILIELAAGLLIMATWVAALILA